MAQKDTGQTKQHAVKQTNAPVKLDFFLAVVPPAHVEQLFHEPAGEILQRGGKHHAAKKGQNGIFEAAIQCIQHQKGAVPINGADKAIQKTALFADMPLADRTIKHLADPAGGAVDHQQQKEHAQVVESIQWEHKDSFIQYYNTMPENKRIITQSGALVIYREKI
mgnify:FL=1